MKTLLVLARGEGKSYFDLKGNLIFDDLPFKVVVLCNKATLSYFEHAKESVEVHPVRWSDPTEVRQIVRDLHTTIGFDRIATLDEMMIDLAAELRQELGIPGMQPEEAARFRDKTVMKRILADHGMRVPHFSPCSDRGRVTDLLSRHEKLIIKPNDGQGSRDIAFVESDEELERWYAGCTDPTEFQAEEYIDGVLYHINALVENGKANLTASAPYLPGMANIDFSSGAPFVSVMLDDGELKRRLEHFSEQVIDALQLSHGVTHLECFVTPEDEIVFCEIANRPGGGGIVLMIEAQHGINYSRAAILLEMGNSCPVPIGFVSQGHVVGLMGFRSKESGFLKRVAPSDQFSENWIHLFRAEAEEGSFVPASAHCTDYVGLIIFSSRDRDEFEHRRSALYHRFYESLDLQAI